MAENNANVTYIARTNYSHAIAAEHRALLLQKTFYHLQDEVAFELCDRLVAIARQHADEERAVAAQAIVSNPTRG